MRVLGFSIDPPLALQKALRCFHMYLVVVPTVLSSADFREQLSRKRKFLPGVATRVRIVRYRDWGEGVSLAITPVFRVPIDTVLDEDHPEICAFLEGEDSVRALMEDLLSRGYSNEYVQRRLISTPKLLAESPSSLFSEVRILASGELRIHDGHHRAGVARALGDGCHGVMVTMKINLS